MESKYIRDLRHDLDKVAVSHKAWGNTQVRVIINNCFDHLIAIAACMEARQRVAQMEQILRDHHLTAGSPTEP